MVLKKILIVCFLLSFVVIYADDTMGKLMIQNYIRPHYPGEADLGTAKEPWGEIRIYDDKYIIFGMDENVTMGFDKAGVNKLLIIGNVKLDGTLEITGTLSAASLDTGEGAFELYGILGDLVTTAPVLGGVNNILYGTDGVKATISIDADGITDTELAFNTGQHLTTASHPTFHSLSIYDASLNVELDIESDDGTTMITLDRGGAGGTSNTIYFSDDGTPHWRIYHLSTDKLHIYDDVNNIYVMTFEQDANSGLVGIGDNSPDAHLDIEDLSIETTANYYGVQITHVKTGGLTNHNDVFYGYDNKIELKQAAGEISHMSAFINEAKLTDGGVGDAGNNRNFYAFENFANIDGTAGSGDIFGNVYGMSNILDIENTMNSITGDGYGIYSLIDDDLGIDGTVYGCYLDEADGVDYGYYQNGTADNYFGGALNVGNVTIGIAAAGVDYTLTFDGEDDDCVITYDEDNNKLNFGNTNLFTTGSIRGVFIEADIPDGMAEGKINGLADKVQWFGADGLLDFAKIDGVTKPDDNATKYPDTGEQVFTDADHTKLDGLLYLENTELFELSKNTTDGIQTELFIDGASEQYILTVSTAYHFNIMISAYQSVGTGTGSVGSYLLTGIIKRIGATTSIVGNVNSITICEDDAAGSWSVTAEADDTNEALVVKVTGEASKTIIWKAIVKLTKAGV